MKKSDRKEWGLIEPCNKRHGRFMTYFHYGGLFVITRGTISAVISKPIVVFKVMFSCINRVILKTFFTKKIYFHNTIISYLKIGFRASVPDKMMIYAHYFADLYDFTASQ